MKESLEKFYTRLLGVQEPWEVISIIRDSNKEQVTVTVDFKDGYPYLCPVCGKEGKRYDYRTRSWRHLDTCQYKTIIECDIPRVQCSEHGVKQLVISWAEIHSRFTMDFECIVIQWLLDNSISTVAKNLNLSWDEVDGIKSRAVKRGLARRKKSYPKNIGIDETSYQKHHNYVTVILDKDKDTVIDILEDRKSETLQKWLKTQEMCDFSKIKSISMDMWDAYINAIKSHFDEADSLIVFDRYHVSGHLGKALDKVRREEHKQLLSEGISVLKSSKHEWLKNSNRIDNRSSRRKKFLRLSQMKLKTARAWRIKEAASMLWDYKYMGVAEKSWKQLLYWISHCQLKPMIAVGKMIRKYFYGIRNAIKFKTNNSMLEAKNACIQRIKKMACGFRNKERFKNAILFHLGGLDLMPSYTR